MLSTEITQRLQQELFDSINWLKAVFFFSILQYRQWAQANEWWNTLCILVRVTAVGFLAFNFDFLETPGKPLKCYCTPLGGRAAR